MHDSITIVQSNAQLRSRPVVPDIVIHSIDRSFDIIPNLFSKFLNAA